MIRRVGDAALWVGAGLGTLSLVAALLVGVFGYVPLIFTSGSMSPEIPAGSLGIARSVGADQLRTGDVVSVPDARGVRVTHRIVSMDARGEEVLLTLKGDANDQPDEAPYPVTEADRVLFSVPWAGRVLDAMVSPLGIFVAGILATTVVFLFIRTWPGNNGERRRDPKRGRHLATVTVIALLLPVTSLTAHAEPTTAYWNDTGGTVTTSNFVTHRVAQPDLITCSVGSLGTALTIGTTSTNDRYTYWVRIFDTAGNAVTPYREMTGSGTARSHTYTLLSGDLPLLALGTTYNARVFARLAGTTWESEAFRSQPISKTTLLVSCGTANPPPSVGFVKPVNGDSGDNDGSNSLQDQIQAACGDGTFGTNRIAACGTTSDDGAVTKVDYILQRTGGTLGVRCWNGGSLWVTDCSFRGAATNATKTKWSVPRATAITYPYLSDGAFLLTIRVTDNSGNVTESAIRFTVFY